MRTCAYKGEGGQKIGHNMYTRTEWKTRNSSFERDTRIVNFEVIQCCCRLCQ